MRVSHQLPPLRRRVEQGVWVGLGVLTLLAGMGVGPWWTVAVIAVWLAASYAFRCWMLSRHLACMTSRFNNAELSLDAIRDGARSDQAVIWWRVRDKQITRQYYYDPNDMDDDDHDDGDKRGTEPI